MRPLATLLLLAGCTSGPLEPQAYFDALGEIDCQAIFRCCDQPMQVSNTASVDACIASKTTSTRWAPVLADVSSGKLTYHADVAGACLNAQRGATASCAARASDVNAAICGGVFTGSLPEGSECPAGGGCASGLLCFQSTVCARPVARGGSCATAPCDRGLACLTGDLCGDPLADGATCQRDAQCASGDCDGTMCRMRTVKQLYCGG